MKHGASSTHGHATPWRRLWLLLRPEGADIGVVAIFALVVGMMSLATPITVEALVNTVAFGRYLQPLLVLAIMLFTFLAFAAVLRGLQAYIVEVIQRRIFVRVAVDLAERLPRVKADAFEGDHAPALLNRFFEVITVQKAAALLVLDGIAIVLTSLIGMVVLAFYHPFLLAFDLVLVAAVAFTVFILGRGAVDSAIQESYKKYAVASWLEQLATFPIAFKLQGGLETAVAEADRLASEYVLARKRHFRILMGQIVFTLALQAFAGATLLGIGGFLVINGQLTLGQLVAAELIVAVIVGSFAKLGKHMESYYDLLAAVDKLGHLLDLPLERIDGLFPAVTDQGARLQFHEVTLRAGDGHSGSLPLTYHIQPGERVAVIGSPGSGKTALLEALYQLGEPLGGYIEYDGIDMRSIRPGALREQVALVRDIEVFESTVMENVLMRRPSVTHASARQALEAVGLWDEIMRFPRGIETPLTPGGAPLTDSQVLRLVIARAIAGAPRLLLIDAVLDQLPDHQRARVLSAIAGPPGERTVIVVTGREPTPSDFDRVLSFTPDVSDGPLGTEPNLTHSKNASDAISIKLAVR